MNFSLDHLLDVSRSRIERVGLTVLEVSKSRPEWEAIYTDEDFSAHGLTEKSVPIEFVEAVLARRNDVKFFLVNGHLRKVLRPENTFPVKEFSALEAFRSYGLQAMYEASEYGSYRVE